MVAIQRKIVGDEILPIGNLRKNMKIKRKSTLPQLKRKGWA